MSESLAKLESRVSQRVVQGMFLLWLAFAVLFQIMIHQMFFTSVQLDDDRFKGVVREYLLNVESRVALAAQTREFRTYLRSGALTREELAPSVLETLSGLLNSEVSGVELVNLEGNQVFSSLGETSNQNLDFQICYLGDFLQPFYGRCLGSLRLHINSEMLFGRLFDAYGGKQGCRDCNQIDIRSIEPQFQLAQLSDSSKLQLQWEASAEYPWLNQIFFLLITALLVAFGLMFRNYIRNTMQKHIIQPINEFLESLETGKSTKVSENQSFDEIIQIQKHHSVASAIARTVQMLAHDVRKPFAVIKVISETVPQIKDPVEVKEFLARGLDEVNQAMASVAGMIKDVMMIGSGAVASAKPVSLQKLANQSLRETSLVFPNADNKVILNFEHSGELSGDASKLGRALVNILCNAIQAAGHSSTLKLQSRDEGSESISFTITNTHSSIPQEEVAQVFDAFFTSRKSGGTGLGLAIAKQVVESHQGQIRCVSNDSVKISERFVSFILTLPKVDGANSEKSASAEALVSQTSLSHFRSPLIAASRGSTTSQSGSRNP